MQIILLEKVANLGALGQTVNVRGGYARNFLLPQGKAVPATKDNIAAFEARRAQLEAQAAANLASAQARKAQIENLSLTTAVKAGDEGKLFGSLNNRDIAELVSASGVAVVPKGLACGPVVRIEGAVSTQNEGNDTADSQSLR